MTIMNIRKFIISFFFLFCTEYFYHCQATPWVGNSVRLAEKNEFPFIVSISSETRENMKSKINHVCGGSLISYSHILTAAHCFDNNDLKRWMAKVGSIDLRRALIYDISWWVTYNEWVLQDDPTVQNGDSCHDVAIAKLSSSVNSSIQLGILTKQPDVNLYGKETISAGWGQIEKEVYPILMRAVELTVHYPEKCSPYLDDSTLINSWITKHLCTYAIPPARMGVGDSGSPLLLHRREIIGVNRGYCSDRDPLMKKETSTHPLIITGSLFSTSSDRHKTLNNIDIDSVKLASLKFDDNNTIFRCIKRSFNNNLLISASAP